MSYTEVQTIKDGIHPSLEEHIYRKDPAIAISDLKEMQYSPAHFYSKKYGGFRQYRTEAMNIGTMVHLRVLEPERFAAETIMDPVDAPKRPTKAQREAKKPSEETIKAIDFWDDWERVNGQKTVLSVEDLAQINGVAAAIEAHPDAAALLANSTRELAMFRTVQVDGQTVRIKGKADVIGNNDIIADIKTVERCNANAWDFGRSVEKWSYHMQAAWYLDLYNGLTQIDDPFSGITEKTKWVFIVAEKEPPFAVATLELDAESIEIGRRMNEAYLKQFAKCQATGEWPGPSIQRGLVTLPEWKKKV